MNLSPEITLIIKTLLLPPGFNLLLFFIALFLFRKFRHVGNTLFIVSLVSLTVFSLPVFSSFVAALIEPDKATDVSEIQVPDNSAVVILGCGQYTDPPEYETDDISACGLIRLRYAAEIVPALHLPVLVSGGRVFGGSISEAEIMSHILAEKFRIQTTWLESTSRNTIENAANSAIILQRHNIDNVFLVTHALHMRRASWLFRYQGFNTFPMPTYFYSKQANYLDWKNWIPSAQALLLTNMVFKEVIGLLWQTVHAYLQKS